MKKSLIFAAVAAVVLSACAKVETVKVASEDEAIGFGVYVPKAVSKAGATGQTTTTSIQRAQADGGGFGVFTYYTDDQTYAGAVAAGKNKPNFMYNQGVFYNSTAWEYNPVKYWPNEYGSGASSGDRTDRLSFFAYAPYVSEASGDEGITAIAPANNAAGDPNVTYVLATDPTKVVDLCWAVDAADGFPWIDETKQTVTGDVNFRFLHALARFNVNVRGYFDEVRSTEGAVSTDDVDENTKITIEKIEIAGSLYPSGVLNLNNSAAYTANWTLTTAETKTLTIANSDIAASLKANEGGESSFPGITVTGVTTTNVNVYTGEAPAVADEKYFTILPNAGDPKTLTVKVTYYVTTRDANLDGGISCVKNVIQKDITFDEFLNGKIYNLNVVLGLTTVKLEATVENWDTETTDKDVDLPVNTAGTAGA